MACLKCNESRENAALYCGGCGDNLATHENPKHTINLLMALLAVELLSAMVWIVAQKIIIPLSFSTPYSEADWIQIGPIFNFLGYFTDAIVAIAALICAMLVKNKNARILFICYLIFRAVLSIAYRLSEI